MKGSLSSSDKRSFKTQWVIVPLLSVLLYRYVYFGGLFNSSSNTSPIPIIEPSSPTHAIVQDRFGRSNNPWKSFPGTFRWTPAFPDQASRYDLLTFMPSTGDFDVIQITGQFPFARYFGINLYDSDQATDFASLADREMIVANAGSSRNPFAIGDYNKNSIPRHERNYTIWLMSESVKTRLARREPRAIMMDHVNIMTYPDNGISTLAFMNRVYRPNRGQDLLGGVPLPTVEAFKLDGTQAMAPEQGRIKDAIKTKVPLFLFNGGLIQTWDLMKQFAPENEVRFHRVSEAGLFPNRHVDYIVAPLEQYYWNKVVVVTMKKTPTVDDTYDGGDFQANVNVRFWSFCVGDLTTTGTPDCLADDEIRHNSDGSSVTIVIASFYLKSRIRKTGLNYLAWGLSYKPLLIHRHMLADVNFAARIGNIPKIGRPPAQEDWNADYFQRHSAEHWMGDYTPRGKILGVSEFFKRLHQGDFQVAFDL
jgi:hypothetical protein